MPTPKTGYFLKDGTKVPGTTTIIGRFKESGGLLQWAFKQGKEGKSHLYEEAEKAADIGTVAHSMVELHLNGEDLVEIANYLKLQLPDIEMARKALSSFNAYQTWRKNFGLEVVQQEIQLVSEKHRYGGTLDLVGFVPPKLALLDWKTSANVYVDYLIQLAAYKNLWEENHPEQPITGGFHLLRFSKSDGDFAHHHYPNLDEAWEQFLLFRKAYDIDKSLKKRAA